VAEHRERVRIGAIAARENLDLRAVLEREPDVAHLAVRPHEHCLLGKLGTDGARGVEAGRSSR